MDKSKNSTLAPAQQAAKEYSDRMRTEMKGQSNGIALYEAFLAGARWQKEQMLKDAVEGEAEELYNDGESQCVVSVGTYFKPGDEVYVIPKED